MGHPHARISIKAVALIAVIMSIIAPTSATSLAAARRNDAHVSSSHLTKRWHAEPPPILQHPCLVVDKHNGRTYMIGFDSQNTLTFNFINSTEACDNSKSEKSKDDKADDGSEEWQEKGAEGFDWQHAHWTSLPHPNVGVTHQGRRFDTEHCFLSSDHKFMVPAYEVDGEGGFSTWDHEARTWTHIRLDRPCSCHEEEVEEGGKVKVKKDAKRLKFEYPNLFAVVYQSYRAQATRHSNTARLGAEEAIDTVVIQWKDEHERYHITGVQLVNQKVYSCHDIKIGHDILPQDLTLATSPNNPYHYTFHKAPKKYKQEGDHGSRCDNTTLFLLGPEGSGWLDISIADRPSKRPVDIVYDHDHQDNDKNLKGGFFHTLPKMEIEYPRSVYYGGQIWIFGKNDQGVGVWSIDTSSSEHSYEIVARSQGGPSPGELTCASCGNGIIVYGGCDRAEDCSTNLGKGEHAQGLEGTAPVVIFRPGSREGDDDDDDDDDDDEDHDHDEGGEGEGHGSGEGISIGGTGHGEGSHSGGHGTGSGSGGEHGGSGEHGGHGEGGAGEHGSGSGGEHAGHGEGGAGGYSSGSGSGSGSGGSGISGGYGSGSGSSGSGSGGSGAGGSGAGGSDVGGSGAGGSGAGGSGAGGSGAGGSGAGGSGAGGSGAGGSGAGGSGAGGSGAGGSGAGGSGAGGSGAGGSGAGGSGAGGSGAGGSGAGGSGAGGSGAGGSGAGGSGAGGSGAGGSGAGGSGAGGSGAGGSGAGGSGAGGSGAGGSGAGGSGAGGSGAGAGGSGAGGSGAGGSGAGAGGSGAGGSGAGAGGVIPGYPYPNPDASGQVMAGASPTTTPIAVPTNTAIVNAPGVIPVPNGAKTGDEGSHKNTGAIVGGVLGLFALIALVSLIFLAARKRRRTSEAVLIEQGAGSDDNLGGAAMLGPEGYIAGGAPDQAKYPGAEGNNMPALTPIGPGAGGEGGAGSSNSGFGGAVTGAPSATGAHSHSGFGEAAAAAGAVLVAGALAKKHKESVDDNNEHFEAGHVTNTADSSTETSVLKPKRSSGAPFFMGGGYRRPGPTPTLPVIAGGSKTEMVENSRTTTEDRHRILAGAAGAALVAGAISAHHHNKETRAEGSSTGETEEVLSSSEGITGGAATGHNRFESSNSTNMNVSENSSVLRQGGITSSSSSTSVSHTAGGSQTIISGKTGERIVAGVTGGAILGAIVGSHRSKEQVVQMPPTVHTTQITLTLSIMRYERSDAVQATPWAKPGTLMFSQVEMLEGAPDVHILGSAFSHARDSSKVTGKETGLPSPVVPGPSGAVSSSESEPRERSLRWMKNEFQWKREAGMLQHLRSDKYVAELFTLYSLPSFAEYRFVSVMGPFTRTLESYIKERKGIRTTERSPTAEEQSLALMGPLRLDEIKSMTDSIASALKWCHDHHVVHLSLTPASIFLQEAYSEPDGQGGYRTSIYSSYSNKGISRDSDEPRIEQQWKLWNFSHARFVGEAVDLNMDMTGYTAPEILIARRRSKTTQTVIATEDPNPNKDTTVSTTVSADGRVTKTTTIKSSTTGTTVISSQDSDKLMASTTMDMWSLGQIVYEMHTAQPMFVSDQDALVKLTSALESPEDVIEGNDEGNDLDRAKAHEKIRQQLEVQIEKIEKIPESTAREVITGLLEMQHERRWDYEEVRNLYLDAQEGRHV